MSMNDKVSLLKELYHEIAGKGQDGDTMLAHINPQEALLLKAHGGSGTINPNTGLPEYKKAIKRIAKIAIPIAAVATGFGMAGYGPLAGMFAQTASIHTGIAGIASGGGLFSAGNLLNAGGLLTNVAGNIQSQKYANTQGDAMRSAQESQNKANEVANRYGQLQAKRARTVAMRQGRIEQGRIEGGVGVLGQRGTSGFSGSVGATGTQANTAKGKSDMWSDVSTLGGTIFNKSGEISNLLGKIF